MMDQAVATPVNPNPRVFDDQHPPAAELLNSCVHCGFCLQNCPTYTLWGKEADSPRGRIHLMSMAIDGEVELTKLYASHFDHCLGCFACVTSCPSGIKYDKLILAMRGQVERLYQRPLKERALRRMIAAVFSRPALAKAGGRPSCLSASRSAAAVSRLARDFAAAAQLARHGAVVA
jgi:glycolate oxidase iron-sulfur subunit